MHYRPGKGVRNTLEYTTLYQLRHANCMCNRQRAPSQVIRYLSILTNYLLLNLEIEDGTLLWNMGINVYAKFNYDWLRIDKVLGD